MKKVEELIEREKLNLDNIEVPDELEGRLKNALGMENSLNMENEKEISNRNIINNRYSIKNRYSTKNRYNINNRYSKYNWKAIIAAVVVIIVTLSYSFDAIAYYGKKILGYDNVTVGNLAVLNDEGRGQEIGKGYTFSDGTIVTLDGIMFDDNEFVAFIREYNSNGINTSLCNYSIKGINPSEYYMTSGSGNFNEARTEISFVYSFKVPHFYEKWLTLEINKRGDNQSEQGSINFTLDRNKAMGHVFKANIDKGVVINGNKLILKAINISPITTVVNGTEELINSMDKPDLSIQNYFDFDLYVNGNKYENSGGNRGGIGNSINFKKEFISVPTEISSLEIKNIKFVTEILVDKMIDISTETKALKLDIKETNVEISKVYTDGEATYVTMKSQKYDRDMVSKYDPNFALFSDKEQITFDRIIDSKILEENGVSYIERTFKFKGKGENMQIGIKVVYTTIGSEEEINIVNN